MQIKALREELGSSLITKAFIHSFLEWYLTYSEISNYINQEYKIFMFIKMRHGLKKSLSTSLEYTAFTLSPTLFKKKKIT